MAAEQRTNAAPASHALNVLRSRHTGRLRWPDGITRELVEVDRVDALELTASIQFVTHREVVSSPALARSRRIVFQMMTCASRPKSCALSIGAITSRSNAQRMTSCSRVIDQSSGASIVAAVFTGPCPRPPMPLSDAAGGSGALVGSWDARRSSDRRRFHASRPCCPLGGQARGSRP